MAEDVFDKICSVRQTRSESETGPVIYDESDGNFYPSYVSDAYLARKWLLWPNERNILDWEYRQRNETNTKSKNLAKGFHIDIICDGTGSMKNDQEYDYIVTEDGDEIIKSITIN